MSDSIYLRNNPSKEILETLVEFPPPPSSKYCNKASPDKLCEGVSWYAKVGHGKFLVKIYVGDPISSMSVNLKINGKRIAENKYIEKNTLLIFEDIIESNSNHLIILTSECKGQCFNSITRISSIKITPYHEK